MATARPRRRKNSLVQHRHVAAPVPATTGYGNCRCRSGERKEKPGLINCIFKRLQMERPLTEDEIRHAHEEAETLVMDEYDSLHKHVFEKEQS